MINVIEFLKKKWIEHCKRVAENPVPYMPVIIFIGIVVMFAGFIYRKLKVNKNAL